MQTRIPTFARSPFFWLVAIVFALEFFLFDHFGAHRHTPFYPRWNDQIQYLSESYTGYEYARAHGVGPALCNALVNRSAQGTLHDFLAILVFLIAGPSRSAALSLNMLALIAWQASLFFAALRGSGSRHLAFASAMLPLALTGPWENIPGSAYDFRLDHLAMCALGLNAAAAVLTDGFRSRRGAIGFGFTVGVTLLIRFLTGTYFVVTFVGFAIWTLSGPDRFHRFLNLLLAAGIAAAMAGPIFWINYDTVREYYWIGHYVGAESAIRNQHFGLGASLAFVAKNLAQRHLGGFIGILIAAGAITLVLIRSRPQPRAAGTAWIVGALFLFAPALILTLHPQKSDVVLSALAPGVITLAVALWISASKRAGSTALSIFAAGASASALLFFARAQLRPAYTPNDLVELRKVNTFADQVFTRTRAAGLADPKISIDYVTDSLEGNSLRVIVYERHHVWVPFDRSLPSSIFEPTESLVMERLTHSDFVFLTEDASTGFYPFDRKIAELRPQLRAWCDAHLRAVEHFTLFGRRMVLYQRPEIPFP